jgi:predicted O-methyltransferase YrrM
MQFADSPLMNEIAEDCSVNHVALIPQEVGELFSFLVESGKYRRILEIGTGLGYSTLWWAQAVHPQGGHIVTIERIPQRLERAREYFSRSSYNNVIKSYVGEARDILPFIEGSFDIIFLDAAMGQYLDFFNNLFPKLIPGGLFIADNIFFENLIFLEASQVRRRHRTMQQRLKSFLQLVREHPDLTTKILPLGDGLVLCWRHTKKRSEIGHEET